MIEVASKRIIGMLDNGLLVVAKLKPAAKAVAQSKTSMASLLKLLKISSHWWLVLR